MAKRGVRGLPFFALLAVACGPTIDEMNAARGAQVEQVLTRAKAVGVALSQAPSPAPAAASSPTASLAFTQPGRSGNAALIYAEDFDDFDELGLVYARLPGASLVSRCSAAVHTERAPWDPAQPDRAPSAVFGSEGERIYDACERLEYLFVIRTDAFVRPTAARVAAAPPASAAPAATRAGSAPEPERRYYEFDGGWVEGELLAFSLSEARLLGATRFQATSSERLSSMPSEHELETDLAAAVEAASKEALRTGFPSVTVVP